MLDLGGVAHWVKHLISNLSVMRLSPVKDFRCFLDLETLTSLLSTGCFQERIINCWFDNQTKLNEIIKSTIWYTFSVIRKKKA